ncbi:MULTISPECIES: hypothetical protein [unclassified Knoellia]|uniref:hypothetical protein n=1 Tax=Knoellia altitudinis TaxID=3404795 RepID=UPI003620B34B
MSSSANRRPRVAGQRRRPLRGEGALVGDDQGVQAPHAEVGSATTTTTTPIAQTQTRAENETETETETEAAPTHDAPNDGVDERDERDDTARPSGSVLPAILAAIAFGLSLALLMVVLVVTREDPQARPRAASAATATARSTLEQILSYNHATMTQQLPANQALLTGSFKGEFAATMTRTIVPLAQKDKTVVKARVYEAGVMSQTDRTITVQAFVNQARTSDVQKEPSIDQNRVIATMTRSGDRWLVSSLKAY